ncbi:MAG: beta-lactamase family protein [Desulfurellaceae bacterium]|nr:beta-lactamase family protein [Desulfurellaceae bacterium]
MQTVDPGTVGMDPERIEHLFGHIEKMRGESWLFGGAFLLARRGKIVAARGVGQVEPETGRPARVDDIFCQFSTTKPITATMLLMKADRGEVQLYEKVSAYIPEFGAAGKRHTTVAQVLTHTAGFPTMPLDWPMAKWADWDATIARLCAQPLEYEPGAAVHYHALTGSWILAEIARRVDGGSRSFAQMCEDELYRPLGMHDSHMGVRPDMHERRVPLQALDEGGAPFPLAFLEAFNRPEIQSAAIPGGGSYSSVGDMARFYQMWLNRGAFDGVRLLSPAMVELATTIHTGDLEDRLLEPIRVARQWPKAPANRGLGFWLRGSGIFPTYFGSLASPRTFGHAGASSIMAWADPARELIFVGMTSGLIEEPRSITRWHVLSDLAQACVVE